MLGHGDTRGLLEMALEDIFTQIHATHNVECSTRKEHYSEEKEYSKENIPKECSSPKESEDPSVSRSKEYSLKLSFIEIYNEKVFDLLSASKNLVTIREDKKNFCSDATEVTIEDQKTIIAAMKKGKWTYGRKVSVYVLCVCVQEKERGCVIECA
jgi:Kinesin motor domain